MLDEGQAPSASRQVLGGTDVDLSVFAAEAPSASRQVMGAGVGGLACLPPGGLACLPPEAAASTSRASDCARDSAPSGTDCSVASMDCPSSLSWGWTSILTRAASFRCVAGGESRLVGDGKHSEGRDPEPSIAISASGMSWSLSLLEGGGAACMPNAAATTGLADAGRLGAELVLFGCGCAGQGICCLPGCGEPGAATSPARPEAELLSPIELLSSFLEQGMP